MTKKLRTLKEIEPKFKKGTDLVAIDMFKEQLKQEVIKHIKELQKTDNHDHKTCSQGNECNWCLYDSHKVGWIIYFFNITEEDLK